MINLRLLKICNVQLPEGLDYLSNNLRLLHWEGYPLKSLPPNLRLDKIIKLNMDHSHIEQLPQGITPFNNLKSISFQKCEYLIKTPDFTSAPNLKDSYNSAKPDAYGISKRTLSIFVLQIGEVSRDCRKYGLSTYDVFKQYCY
ncbi:hypothetical protein Patl1_26881 [Pistacia atlantica]|uniref:Uncharacterized protein n=1 Tax=Pistacia atlantica TaxID=434234 RepID=A0ACC1AZQ5_9ROSI|nr:hypothetical protein Patl1_26881 [Pistacia atlantica]